MGVERSLIAILHRRNNADSLLGIPLQNEGFVAVLDQKSFTKTAKT